MELIIHIGLPKTATTTIQNSLSRDLTINYFNQKGRDLLQFINSADNKLFKNNCSKLESKLDSLLTAKKLNVISFESFTDVITPIFSNNHNDHSTKADRLQMLFGKYDPKIIITIRI